MGLVRRTQAPLLVAADEPMSGGAAGAASASDITAARAPAATGGANPVPVNSQLRMLSKVIAIEPLANNGLKATFSCTIEIKGQEKPACVAEFLAAFYE